MSAGVESPTLRDLIGPCKEIIEEKSIQFYMVLLYIKYITKCRSAWRREEKSFSEFLRSMRNKKRSLDLAFASHCRAINKSTPASMFIISYTLSYRPV